MSTLRPCSRLGHSYNWPISELPDGRWLYVCATCGHHVALTSPETTSAEDRT